LASKREQVLEAVLRLARSALPYAEVARNRDKPQSISAGGDVVIRDGDPGDPVEITLSPLTHWYEHRIPLEIGTYASGGRSAGEVLDDMLRPLGEAIMADRTLGGLVDWLDVGAPVTDAIESFGIEPGRWADVDLIAHYGVTNPLA
jgi:hypothetical protein